MISMVAVGAIVFGGPVSVLIARFGVRRMFTALGVLSALCTALIPISVNTAVVLIVLRIGQGIAYVSCYMIVGTTVASWCTLQQHGMFVSILSLFRQIAPSFTNPIAGALCTSTQLGGWPTVYYFHACVTVGLFAIFAAYYRDSPADHRLVSNVELAELQAGKVVMVRIQRKTIDNKLKPPMSMVVAIAAFAVGDVELVKKQLHIPPPTPTTPYMSILRTPAIWAVWIAAFGDFFGTNLVLLYAPTYLNEVIRFPIGETGLTTALPTLVQAGVKLFTGFASDRIRCVSEDVKIRVFGSAAMFGPAACFIALAIVTSPDWANLSLALLVAAQSLNGFGSAGLYKSATLVGRHHTAFPMAIVAMLCNVNMLVVPLLVENVAIDNTIEQWAIVFYVVAAVMIGTHIFFLIFASGQPAVWTNDDYVEKKTNVVADLNQMLRSKIRFRHRKRSIDHRSTA